jgi:hypothetical protein
MKAYRQLLLERSKVTDKFSTESEPMAVPEELPEAPQTLVAPTPVTPEQKPETPVMDIIAKNFATSLGYYLTRKGEGASQEELVSLLNQLKAVYGPNGMDMSFVNNELSNLPVKQQVAPQKETIEKETDIKADPVPVVKPAKTKTAPVKPTVKPAPKQKTETPTPSASPAKPTTLTIDQEFERGWNYYQQMKARDIPDHEKVELLDSLLRKFGERGADRIKKELERIRNKKQ